jgi:hypothetical protein
LKPEWLGSPLVQEKYQDEKAYDKRHPYRIIIIIIVIVIIVIIAEKILKYKGLTIEIQCTWNIKTKVIPVIIGATGTISRSFRKYVSNNIPVKQKVK